MGFLLKHPEHPIYLSRVSQVSCVEDTTLATVFQDGDERRIKALTGVDWVVVPCLTLKESPNGGAASTAGISATSPGNGPS